MAACRNERRCGHSKLFSMLAAGVFVIVSTSCQSPTGGPNASAPRTPESLPRALAPAPSPRWSFGVAYDEMRHQVVLFGGVSDFQLPVLGDTWIWDGLAWSQAHPVVAPPPTSGDSMAYDPNSQRVIFYDSQQSTGLHGTWAWDGHVWAQIHTTQDPGFRSGFSLAWDPGLERLLLFGGAAGPNSQLSDTWTWTGSDWQQLSVKAPAFRGYFSGGMGFEPLSKRMMLWGFDGGAAEERSMWFLESAGWVGKPTLSDGSLPYFPGAMWSDPDSGRLIMFGGQNTKQRLNGTWTWNGSNWEAIPTGTQPTPRTNTGFAFDAAKHVGVLFGGRGEDLNSHPSAYDDTWAWVRSDWNLVVPMRATPS